MYLAFILDGGLTYAPPPLDASVKAGVHEPSSYSSKTFDDEAPAAPTLKSIPLPDPANFKFPVTSTPAFVVSRRLLSS